MARPVERFLWGEICRDYDCPMGNEAFNHEIGKECEKNPMEAWISEPADIILTSDAAKAYREAPSPGKLPSRIDISEDLVLASKSGSKVIDQAQDDRLKQI